MFGEIEVLHKKAWDIAIAVVNEAENRYGLTLFATVSPRGALYEMTFLASNLTIDRQIMTLTHVISRVALQDVSAFASFADLHADEILKEFVWVRDIQVRTGGTNDVPVRPATDDERLETLEEPEIKEGL